MFKIKRYFIPVIIITLFGEIYFYPFQVTFRFSAGVLAFSLTILLYKDLEETYLGILTGISVLILRGFVDLLNYSGNLIEILKNNFPSSLYYILFGILAHFSSLKKSSDNAIKTISTLFLIDVFSNIFESLLRNNLNLKLFHCILVIGLIRSIITYTIFIVFKNQEILIRKKEHQKRYAQLNAIISNLQAEMFYLKKSMKDIENVMSKSHNLYEKNKHDQEISKIALDIAREVHEIKKDYYRVLSGLENFIKDFETDEGMSFKDIITIIENNLFRYIKHNNKDINISFKINDNIYVKKYYYIFTILNNLIINSIESFKEKGNIQVIQKVDSNNIILIIFDNGEGIEEDILPYIFNPGFTTKFDQNTGEPSTGIGLAHVKNIVEHLKGTIIVESKKNIGTTFKISIPLDSLGR
ncbi:two-component system sensor histidine kinase YcbA [Keratinibaculum paraultunense]|uniref:histidine kinase n=1 Tax=Keratinibaculum paraultunense TaxID=1278232 RepID=A0A4R3KXA2_9FIRM|nr:ATP-binding protein [Keratinibaculum paraultunense]QQY78777.1 hypothetical protein JL105_06020 [Keratinibaculum paraultunense]TCS89538.1 two-component system sensor histidine kinase YcbA [Keratinibaculum paraultunense]